MSGSDLGFDLAPEKWFEKVTKTNAPQWDTVCNFMPQRFPQLIHLGGHCYTFEGQSGLVDFSNPCYAKTLFFRFGGHPNLFFLMTFPKMVTGWLPEADFSRFRWIWLPNVDPVWIPLTKTIEIFEVSGPGWDPGCPWAGSKAPNCSKMKSSWLASRWFCGRI